MERIAGGVAEARPTDDETVAVHRQRDAAEWQIEGHHAAAGYRVEHVGRAELVNNVAAVVETAPSGPAEFIIRGRHGIDRVEPLAEGDLDFGDLRGRVAAQLDDHGRRVDNFRRGRIETVAEEFVRPDVDATGNKGKLDRLGVGQHSAGVVAGKGVPLAVATGDADGGREVGIAGAVVESDVAIAP